MTWYYLDTSAILKRYRTEQGSDVVGALFSAKQPDEVFVTSHFTSVEVEAVAARALKGRVLNRRAYGVLLRLFAEDLESQLVILPVSTALVSEAAAAARRYALRAADALRIATAGRLQRGAAPEVFLVTSDKELVRAGEAAGFAILDPEAADAWKTLNRLRA